VKLGGLDITRENALPWLRLGAHELSVLARERIGRLPRRERRALAYVREHARAGDADAVLAAMDRFAREDSFLMNVGDEKGEILDRAVRDSGAGRALELGAFCGYSAVRIARLLRTPGSELTSIELSRTRVEVAGEMVAHAGLSERVRFLHGATQDVIPTLEGKFRLVFIDHDKNRYLQDLLLIEKHELLEPGAIVVADNVGMFTGMQSYLGHVRGSGLYASVHHPAQVEYGYGIADMVEVSTWLGDTTTRS
jgi:catechol O-methyltransferase